MTMSAASTSASNIMISGGWTGLTNHDIAVEIRLDECSPRGPRELLRADSEHAEKTVDFSTGENF